jgi:hypothetical protein
MHMLISTKIFFSYTEVKYNKDSLSLFMYQICWHMEADVYIMIFKFCV